MAPVFSQVEGDLVGAAELRQDGEGRWSASKPELLERARQTIYANPGKYVSDVYGEQEAGGTAMLYISDVPFEQLGFKPEALLQDHVKDRDGKKHGDLPPGRGVVDFPPYLEALKAAGFDGTVSIELEYSPEPTPAIRSGRKAMRVPVFPSGWRIMC